MSGSRDPATNSTDNLARHTRYRPYPDYKDTNVDGLNHIPSHWTATRLKRVCRFEYGASLPSESRSSGNVPVYGSNGAVGTHDSANALGPCLVIGRKGSFGRVNYCPTDVFAIDTTFYVDRRSTSVDIRWLYYLLSHSRLDAASRDSAIPGLDREDAYARNVVLCHYSEQRAIADFLDRETAKIDGLLAKKKRLIKLLQEKRNAAITYAATKGLNPDSPMKESGFDWIGDIPNHWDLAELRRRWTIIDCKHMTVPFVGNGIPLASVREAQSFHLDLSGAKRTTEEWYELLVEGGRRPRPGDLIYCRNVSVGAASLVTTEDRFAMGQDVCIIRSSIDNSKWLNYFLSSRAMAHQLASAATGSTFDRINVSEIRSLVVPVVPQDEQEAIAKALDCEIARIDLLMEKVVGAIARLREFRTALISAAITGKINVRETST